uniref:Uncharacterized protein n=1 Tax=Timema genevievae TaxID=629358 RepID=A0A7R9PKU8_TIMGE|nr:unnamed protein product [Timema genevievae]
MSRPDCYRRKLYYPAHCRCLFLVFQSSLLQGFNQLHPSHTKKQKHWEGIESLWLHFLLDFTYHPEGQLVVPKTADDREMGLNPSQVDSGQFFQNCFPHSFFANVGEFLQVLHQKLSEGSAEEKGMAASMIWSLVANNQKGKLIVKCSGLDTKLQEAVNQLTLTSKSSPSQSEEKLQIMNYVLRHVMRMEKDRMPKKALQNKEKGRRLIGRQRRRWMDQAQKDMEAKRAD